MSAVLGVSSARGVAQPGTISGDLIAQLRMLEEMKSAISGLQAQIAVAFDLAQRAEQAEAGVPAAERGKGVGAQVALARRESPNRGSRLLGLAKALVTEMPRTLAALNKGLLNEWRATLLVKETACLSVEDRAAVDAELAPDTGTFDGAGDKAIIAAAKAAAYRRDPRSVAQRASHAATERTVSLRPAPDTMTYLTALLPVAQGVAVYAALTRAADSARSRGWDAVSGSGAGSGSAAGPGGGTGSGGAAGSGSVPTRGQIMADTLVQRVTGTPGGISGVELQVVMTDRTLFQSDSEPARLHGYGIVPAPWARTLIGAATHPEQPVQPTSYRSRWAETPTPAPDSPTGHGSPPGIRSTSGQGRQPARGAPAQDLQPAPEQDQEFKVWLRRLYTAPESGELLAMDSKARLFPHRHRRFIEARDHTCRTPYCDAPIRHIDHVVPWHSGGATTLDNAAGLCEACNHTKENPGWAATPLPEDTHTLSISTPTGHTYQSKAPPLPGHRPSRT
nr:HNH endonuclease signature motif containing protein [Paenarthrobacter nicotinovorans]